MAAHGGNLPQGVSDYLKELSTQAKRHGGLHAASGTLGSSSRDKSVRMALLGILFKSVGLEAARLLDVRYHLVITNVPYKNLNELCEELRDFCTRSYPDVKGDLANVFLERCIELLTF